MDDTLDIVALDFLILNEVNFILIHEDEDDLAKNSCAEYFEEVRHS